MNALAGRIRVGAGHARDLPGRRHGSLLQTAEVR